MFGVIFIYFIGKYFYSLAKDFQKNHWLYTVLGVVSYYGTTIVFGVVLFVLIDMFNSSANSISDTVAGLIGIPFGIGGCYFCYKYLEKKWKSKEPNGIAEIDQIGGDTSRG